MLANMANNMINALFSTMKDFNQQQMSKSIVQIPQK